MCIKIMSNKRGKKKLYSTITNSFSSCICWCCCCCWKAFKNTQNFNQWTIITCLLDAGGHQHPIDVALWCRFCDERETKFISLSLWHEINFQSSSSFIFLFLSLSLFLSCILMRRIEQGDDYGDVCFGFWNFFQDKKTARIIGIL